MMRDTVLGLDIGGSSVKYLLAAALLSEDVPEALLEGTADTPGGDPIESLAALVLRLADGTDLRAVVVAVPGLVDEARGVVLRASNLPSLDGVELGRELSERIGVPVRVLNDGHAAALAEARWGAGEGVDDVFTVTLGTGVAGCHVVGGEVASGAHGVAGELGHVVVEPGGAACACGQRGCLETVVGAPALTQAWNAAGGSGSPKELLAAAADGDRRAQAIVERAADRLADALLTLSALVDPGAVVIGGGIASAPHLIVTLAADSVARGRTFHQLPRILPARIGRFAGAVGCAAAARELAAESRPAVV